MNRLIFNEVIGGRFINSMNTDVVFNMQNIGIKGIEAPQILYLHQALPFTENVNYNLLENENRKLAIYQKIIGKNIISNLKYANHIIVQTKWMKKKTSEYVSPPQQVSIIPPNVNILNKTHKDKIKFNHFFYPTSDVDYKKIDTLEKASKILNEEGYNFLVDITINSSRKIRNVNYIGNLSYKEVLKRYENSVLVFPSVVETYGLPLKEASEVGTIIMASETEFAKEILNKYPNSYLFPQGDSVSLASLMRDSIEKKIPYRSIVKENNKTWDSWYDVLKLILKS